MFKNYVVYYELNDEMLKKNVVSTSKRDITTSSDETLGKGATIIKIVEKETPTINYQNIINALIDGGISEQDTEFIINVLMKVC